jgi:hypothetical protein
MEESRMKRIFYALVVMGTIMSTSCVTLISTLVSGNKASQQSHWRLGRFVNEWEEPTGKYFTMYEGTVSAMFYYGSSRKESATIKELTFSESEGFVFLIPGATGMNPGREMDIDLAVKLPDNTEKNFTGFFYGPMRRKIAIDYSEDLRDTLLTENIEIRLSMRNGHYRYRFKFPEQFKNAYEKLMIKQNDK